MLHGENQALLSEYIQLIAIAIQYTWLREDVSRQKSCQVFLYSEFKHILFNRKGLGA